MHNKKVAKEENDSNERRILEQGRSGLKYRRSGMLQESPVKSSAWSQPIAAATERIEEFDRTLRNSCWKDTWLRIANATLGFLLKFRTCPEALLITATAGAWTSRPLRPFSAFYVREG